MKIVLKRTDEQVELIKALASKNREVAFDAQVALAEFIGPVLAEVINNAPTISNLFTSLQFNAEDNPSIPLDLYYDIFDEDYKKTLRIESRKLEEQIKKEEDMIGLYNDERLRINYFWLVGKKEHEDK